MTVQLSLAWADREQRVRCIPGGITLSMSRQNAVRMLSILGVEDTDEASFLPHQAMGALAGRALAELRMRQTISHDAKVRYEVPRLEQLHVLFTTALKKGLGVAVTELPSDT